jgi:predicted nucleotidyltransferase component of viral defense system
MYELLKTKLAEYGSDRAQKYNYLREYLQLLILKILDEKGYFRHIAFVGGTALRILYDLNRFSEDLDFCLIDKAHFDFKAMIHVLVKELQQQNFQVEFTAKDNKTVASGFIKFNQLLLSLGVSPHLNQKLSIKIEIDCNPPTGFKTEFTMINKEFLIGIQHYDLPSLFAGKLHAILCRAYTKGRDYYDLIWFLGRKIDPN